MLDLTSTKNAVRRKTMLSLLIALLLIGAAPVLFAQSGEGAQQVDVSQDELEQFAAALESVQSIQQEMVEETQGAVADSSLEQSRFQELYRAENGGPSPSNAASEAEEEEFATVMEQITEIQKGANEEMIQAVQDEGLEVQRFNQIAQAIQRNQELQQRFQELQS